MKTSDLNDPPQAVFDPGSPLWQAQVNIRPADAGDLPALEWEGEYTRFRQIYAEAFRRMRHGLARIWVMELDGQGVIGQAIVQFKMHEKGYANGGTRAYIHSFRVRPEWQGQGLGTRLLGIAEDDLREQGFQEVTLNVAKENVSAIRLYKRLGYEIFSETPGKWSYYDEKDILRHVHEPGYRMIKSLNGR